MRIAVEHPGVSRGARTYVETLNAPVEGQPFQNFGVATFVMRREPGTDQCDFVVHIGRTDAVRVRGAIQRDERLGACKS
jgi:hypothetical protein